MKKCGHCKEIKSLDSFHRNRSKPGGLATICKSCRLIWDQAHKTDPRRREMFQRANIRRRERPLVRAKLIWRNAKVRAERFNAPFDVTLARIEFALLIGKCERTGIDFDLGFPKIESKTNPFAPSIDKVDPHGHYADGNIQVVCWTYNMGKQQMPVNAYEDFILNAAEFIRQRRERISQ